MINWDEESVKRFRDTDERSVMEHTVFWLGLLFLKYDYDLEQGNTSVDDCLHIAEQLQKTADNILLLVVEDERRAYHELLNDKTQHTDS